MSLRQALKRSLADGGPVTAPSSWGSPEPAAPSAKRARKPATKKTGKPGGRLVVPAAQRQKAEVAPAPRMELQVCAPYINGSVPRTKQQVAV